MKHAVLVWLLDALRRKETPFAALDTHAGIGHYDLQSPEAQRTGEAAGGILRLLDDPPPPLARYVDLVRTLGLYPGSPALVRALLRPDDRLVCCELHPEDHAALRRYFARDRQVSVHWRDGYEAVTGLLPPAQKRGLVLIDPPYEVPDEFDRAEAALKAGLARFPAGIFALWYPIKHRAPLRGLFAAMAGFRDVVTAELLLRAPLDAARLNGCGMIVVNPPWRFEEEVPPILTSLLSRLGAGEEGAAACVERLAGE